MLIAQKLCPRCPAWDLGYEFSALRMPNNCVLCSSCHVLRLMFVLAYSSTARLAQSVERKALNLVVVGSSPTVGAFSDVLRGNDGSS
jgi:hypothetical protein